MAFSKFWTWLFVSGSYSTRFLLKQRRICLICWNTKLNWNIPQKLLQCQCLGHFLWEFMAKERRTPSETETLLPCLEKVELRLIWLAYPSCNSRVGSHAFQASTARNGLEKWQVGTRNQPMEVSSVGPSILTSASEDMTWPPHLPQWLVRF